MLTEDRQRSTFEGADDRRAPVDGTYVVPPGVVPRVVVVVLVVVEVVVDVVETGRVVVVVVVAV